MGFVTVYVDLWSAPDKDPGEIIATALGRAIQARQGHIAKFASKVGLKTITVGGVLEIDTAGIGQPGGTALVKASFDSRLGVHATAELALPPGPAIRNRPRLSAGAIGRCRLPLRMAVLRCTAKLLNAMKVKAAADLAPSSNRLGEWTATLLRVGRIRLVLVVSDRTRHAVVIEAAPYATIPRRFALALRQSLARIGIPPDLAAQEILDMQPMEIAASNSRSVLGTLNQTAWRLELEVRDGARSAAELTEHLADNITTINGQLDFPIDHVRAAFGLGRAERRR